MDVHEDLDVFCVILIMGCFLFSCQDVSTLKRQKCFLFINIYYFSQFLLKQRHYYTFLQSLSWCFWLTHSLTQTDSSLYLLHHLFRVLVHRIHEGAHVLGVHVGVKTVAQVGDVAPRAETLQHLLDDV